MLIIGAGSGSGNDVATALAYGATQVDAVEIDPALYEIGRASQPNHAYQDARLGWAIGGSSRVRLCRALRVSSATIARPVAVNASPSGLPSRS